MVLNVLGVSKADRQPYFDSLPCTRFVGYSSLDGSPDGCPHRLLRAMRLRSQRSQSEIARHLGVTGSAVSQWERGYAWPSTENLHQMCFFLGADPEEMMAIDRGGARLGAASDWTLDSFSDHIQNIEASVLKSTANPLLDLEAISLESDALIFAKRESVPGKAHELLGEVRATYAHGLLLWGRLAEAKHTATHALQTSHSSELSWYQYRANLVYAQCMIGSRGGISRHQITTLGRLMEHVSSIDTLRGGSYRTWIALTLADATAQRGRQAETFEYVRIAQQAAMLGNCADTELSRWEMKLLNHFGQYDRALKVLETSLKAVRPSDHVVGIQLEAVRAALGLQNAPLALEWLATAERQIRQQQLSVYDAAIQDLRQRLA